MHARRHKRQLQPHPSSHTLPQNAQSRRDTFRTLDDIPLGKIDELGVTWFEENIRSRSPKEDFCLDTKIDARAGMLYSYPGMNPDILDSMVDKGYHGIVIIGTGLGYVGTDMFPPLERCQEEEISVVLVVEPLYGYIHLRVYETGRETCSHEASSKAATCSRLLPTQSSSGSLDTLAT